ncbi:MAG: tRNA lysidine(34) synthetase TilS [Caulobacterales bacterium]
MSRLTSAMLDARPPELAAAALCRRLDRDCDAPVAVAVSGGSDSLALLLIAAAWAKAARRRLVVLTVDHGLQPASAGWARAVARRAEALGLAWGLLCWEGAKPAAGLAAAARAARHALLADAARAAGAQVILMGHTADDIAETLAMQAAGAGVPTPREWSPSPAWPQGRGVFLLRPLLGLRRADLRHWLAARRETWIDDPANDDQRYARARARRTLMHAECGEAELPVEPAADSALLAAVREGGGGELTLPSGALAAAPDDAGRVLAKACLCAAGTSRPPRSEAARRLAGRIQRGERFVASLAGARVESADDVVSICREPGEFRRSALLPAPLPEAESVFDGRFVITAPEAGLTVRPLAGVASRLPARERAALRGLSPAVRAGLPAVVFADGRVTCPILAQPGAPTARALAGARFSAALGAYPNEAALRRVAKTCPAS